MYKTGKVRRYSVLGTQLELKLMDYELTMCKLYYRIDKHELCKIAYKLAVKNKIKHNFNKDKKSAGQD